MKNNKKYLGITQLPVASSRPHTKALMGSDRAHQSPFTAHTGLGAGSPLPNPKKTYELPILAKQ